MPLRNYQRRPTSEVVRHYCKMIEKFLSAQKLSAAVTLREKPAEARAKIEGPGWVNDRWIERIAVTTPLVKDFEVRILHLGISEQMADGEIWEDAKHIQDQLYLRLYGTAQHPWAKDDPYWKLWDFLRRP